MSISSEITRLTNAKSSLKTSIENKGVEVPSAATLDDYPELVDQISGGGTPWDLKYLAVSAPNGKASIDSYTDTTATVSASLLFLTLSQSGKKTERKYQLQTLTHSRLILQSH